MSSSLPLRLSASFPPGSRLSSGAWHCCSSIGSFQRRRPTTLPVRQESSPVRDVIRILPPLAAAIGSSELGVWNSLSDLYISGVCNTWTALAAKECVSLVESCYALLLADLARRVMAVAARGPCGVIRGQCTGRIRESTRRAGAEQTEVLSFPSTEIHVCRGREMGEAEGR